MCSLGPASAPSPRILLDQSRVKAGIEREIGTSLPVNFSVMPAITVLDWKRPVEQDALKLAELGRHVAALAVAQHALEDTIFAEFPRSARFAVDGVLTKSPFFGYIGKHIGLYLNLSASEAQNPKTVEEVAERTRTGVKSLIALLFKECGAAAPAKLCLNAAKDVLDLFQLSSHGQRAGSLKFQIAKLTPVQAEELLDYRFRERHLLEAALPRKAEDSKLAVAFWQHDFIGEHLLNVFVTELVMELRADLDHAQVAPAVRGVLGETGLHGEKLEGAPTKAWLERPAWSALYDLRLQLRAVLGAMWKDGAQTETQRLVRGLFEPLIRVDRSGPSST